MMESARKLRLKWAAGDLVRDAGLEYPGDVERCCDIVYGVDADNLLDVYYPTGSEGLLPTIVSVHGGGWFYGTKELYSHYCTRLARRGFAVVNFDYRLAPEYKYPAPVEDTCRVLKWMQENAESYHIDLNNVFLVGDSAGGQIGYQTLIALTNPGYAAMLPFHVPENFTVRACGMNCGAYFIPPFSKLLPPARASELFAFYFPEDYLSVKSQLKMHRFVNRSFPPAFVMTAGNDYLKIMARPLHLMLKAKGVESQLHIFGTRKDKELGHVFHLNCKLEQADICNDMECEFFRRHMV